MLTASATNSLARLMQFLANRWEIVLLVVGLASALIVGVAKGAKYGFRVLTAVFFTMLATVVLRAVSLFLRGGKTELIRFAVAWGPTVLFALIVGLATLMGVKRGLRKSLILAVHALCVAAVCITLFFVSVNSRKVDVALLRFVNLFFKNGGLQAKLGVSADCATLREVFAEYIPKKLKFGQAVMIVLYDNGAYLMALVDMAFRIAVAVVLAVVYFILVFLLYIVYLIAYSERRYKARKMRLFSENRTDSTYKKRALGGGMIGLARGLCAGLITMSLLGGVLYAVAGGKNSSKVDDAAFGDRDNLGITVYRSIEDYGAQGIFKLLNGFHDSDNAPYYLFAADLVFSGHLTDETLGIDENVRLLKELSAYTEFAKSTLNLLVKYGGESAEAIASGGVKNVSVATLTDIMGKPAFRMEFENLIDTFETQTYIINFAMSAVNSIIAHIDDVSFASSVSETNREILKVLFKKGYLCERIPDDAEALSGQESKRPVYPHLNFAQLFSKEDAKVVFRIVTSFLQSKNSGEETETLTLVRNMIPELQKLSVVNGKRKDYFDPVYTRLYTYLANRYLVGEDGVGVRYENVRREGVQWSQELYDLLDVSEYGLELYDVLKAEEGETMNKALSIFDPESEDYEKNMARYDAVTNAVTGSHILGNILSSGRLREKLQKTFASASASIYIDPDIAYADTYDAAGTLVRRGELYNLLHGLRLLGDADNKELLDSMTSGEKVNAATFFDNFSAALQKKDARGNTLVTYMSESSLLRSLVSAVMIDNRYADDEEHKQNILYVPALSLQRDAKGQTVNLIKKSEFSELLTALSSDAVMDILRTLTGGESETDLGALLQKEEVIALFERGNGILEGTFANLLIDEFEKNKNVVVPVGLKGETNLDKWVSYRDRGELSKIMHAIKETELDFAKLMKGEVDGQKLFDALAVDPVKRSAVLFDSQVIHYSVSKLIIDGKIAAHNGITLIVPSSVAQAVEGEMYRVIAKKELVTLFSQVAALDLHDDSKAQHIVKMLVEHKNALSGSKILCASLAYYLFGGESVKIGGVTVPTYFKDASSMKSLQEGEGAGIMQKELTALINSLEVMFADDDYVIDGDAWKKKVTALIPTLNELCKYNPRKTNLQVFYASGIVLCNLSEELENALLEHNVVKSEVLEKAKDYSKPWKEKPFKFDELEALVYLLGICDIDDISQIDDGFSSDLQDKVLTLDEEYGTSGKTKLSLIYPSVVVQAIVADALDDVFYGETPLIEEKVRDAIKANGENGYYALGEIAALINGVKNGLGYGSLDDVKGEKYSDFALIREKDIGVICASDLLSGVLTKAVKESFGGTDGKGRTGIVHSARAYKSDEMPVYRPSEFEAIVALTRSIEGEVDLNSLDITAIDLTEVADFIYDEETGRTASYLLAATVSFKLLEEPTSADGTPTENALIVPYTVILKGENMIRPYETARLIRAFTCICGSADIENFSMDMLRLPDPDAVDEVLKSAIMRASITQAIVDNNPETTTALFVSQAKIEKTEEGKLPHLAKQTVSADNIWSVYEASDEVCAIGGAELKQLFVLFRVVHSDGDASDFTLPILNSSEEIMLFIADCSDKGVDESEILSTDILRYRISSVLVRENPALESAAKEEIVYNVRTHKSTSIQALDSATILGLLGRG